jgi:choline kinase
LKEAGVTQIFVVTGHLREQLAEEIAVSTARHGISVTELHNPDFQEGSVLSMAVSLPQLESSSPFVLILDGDVLYDGRMIERLLQSPHRTTLLLDRGYSCADDDPVIVPIVGGRPVDFIKRWRGEADELGESIGFFKIDARERGAGRMDSYDDVLRVMVLKGLIRHEDVTGIPWTEIDFPGDVDFANTSVFPQLIAPRVSTSPTCPTP